MKKIISNSISYIEASDNPLSADIGIVETQNGVWLFDVGNDINKIEDLKGEFKVVLSHFHADHIGSINNINKTEVYLSKKTFEHVKYGNIIDKDIYIDNIHLFLLPSSHAKGCVCMEIDEFYTFVGDALYSKVDAKDYIFNSQLLLEEIKKLESIKSTYLLVSHYPGLVRSRLEVIEELKEIYSYRTNESHEIRIPRV